MIAAALGVWLALAARADGGAPDGGDGAGAPPPVRAEQSDGGPGAGARPRRADDEELLRHLEEIEKLDLLQNLELFDPGPEREPPAKAG